MNKRLKKIFDENDFEKKFNIDEAVDLAINTATTKFDETIELVASWYNDFYSNRNLIKKSSLNQIIFYEKSLRERLKIK